MRDVTEKDWKEFTLEKATYPILESALDGQSPNLHLGWIVNLYKKYRLGDWNNKIPDPDKIEDKTYIMWIDESYCLFHQKHHKFGMHIIECAHPYAKNVFVFFDYSILKPAFDALDNQKQLPYIPIHYASPDDRYDYQTGAHMWDI